MARSFKENFKVHKTTENSVINPQIASTQLKSVLE
jgi:hypothetical protein